MARPTDGARSSGCSSRSSPPMSPTGWAWANCTSRVPASFSSGPASSSRILSLVVMVKSLSWRGQERRSRKVLFTKASVVKGRLRASRPFPLRLADRVARLHHRDAAPFSLPPWASSRRKAGCSPCLVSLPRHRPRVPGLRNGAPVPAPERAPGVLIILRELGVRIVLPILHNVVYGFQVALQPFNLMYCFFGVLIGTLVGVLPGLGPAAAIALLLPGNVQARPCLSDHHARRHLLWRHVRGVDHVDPRQYPRRGSLGSHLSRRVPDGPEGEGRARPRHCRLRLLHRRDLFRRSPSPSSALSWRTWHLHSAHPSISP